MKTRLRRVTTIVATNLYLWGVLLFGADLAALEEGAFEEEIFQLDVSVPATWRLYAATQVEEPGPDHIAIVSDISKYHYQWGTQVFTVAPDLRLRIVLDATVLKGQMALGVLDVKSDTWIATTPILNDQTVLVAQPPLNMIRIIVSNNNAQPAQSSVRIRSLRVTQQQPSQPGLLDMSRAEPLWGKSSVNSPQIITQDGLTLFPSVTRLPLALPEEAPWFLDLSVTNTLALNASSSRRDIVDFGILLNGGRIQAWWGHRLAGGIRLRIDGRTVRHASAVALQGTRNRLGLTYDKEGSLHLSLNGKRVISAKVAFDQTGGDIALATRNSPVQWTILAATGLSHGAGAPTASPEKFAKPVWDEREAVPWGYQPIPTHLWNRWLGDYLPPLEDFPGLPWLDKAGESPVTHGPLLGLPDPQTIGLLIRTRQPMDITIVGGPSNNPQAWRPLGTIHTDAATGNLGSLKLLADQLNARVVNFSLAVDGRLVDTRVNGRWPQLKQRWGQLPDKDRIRIAVTTCDNFFPTATPPLPDSWLDRTDNLDLLVHLGDLVYEQSYRRRLEVSRLDYLATLAPTQPAGKRSRFVPMVGVFDDHELFNDITGTGEVHRFATPPNVGAEHPVDLPWRIASRDIGRLAWEQFVGWGTPVAPAPSAVPTLVGQATLRDGALYPDNSFDWTAMNRAALVDVASLIIWPNRLPDPDKAITPPAAGVYRIAGIDAATGKIALDPPVIGTDEVSFGLSGPRYGSVRLGTAELLLLDLRTARTFWRSDPYAKEPTMLGAQQRAWLLDKIRTSTAKTLLIATSNTVTFHNGQSLQKRDSWTGYKFERDLILDALRERGGLNILLAGDLHNAAVRQVHPSIVEVVVGSWSNSGFCGLKDSVDLLPQFPDAQLLWTGPQQHPDCEWIAYSSFIDIGPKGDVGIEIMDLATGKIAFHSLFAVP